MIVSQCADPGVPVNGTRAGNVFNVGSTVTFKCDLGFDLQGISSATCGVDGMWSSQLPTCSGNKFDFQTYFINLILN